MASRAPLNIVVPVPLVVVKALALLANTATAQLSGVNGQNLGAAPMTLGDAYKLLAQLVQAVGPISNNQRGMNATSGYTPAASNNNLNNPLVRNQPMNESQLFSAAAGALALEIAKAIAEAMAQPQARQAVVFSSELPNLPLQYLFPLDKSAQVIYLYGRVVDLPPMLLVILEKLLAAPANTIVSIRDGFFAVTDNAWNVHMHKLRVLLQEVIKVETVKMQGYKLSVNTEVLKMPFEQRCRKAAQDQLEQHAIPMEVEVY